MLTNVQGLINELTGYQVPIEQRSLLAGKGTAMKTLALNIKDIFPSLTTEDKGLFLAAVARGRFAIEPKTIWPMFLNAVGIETPAASPAAPAPAPAATNKVAGEILDMAKAHLVGLKLIEKALSLHGLCIDRQSEQGNDNHAILQSLVGMVSDLQKQVAELKRPATKRTLAAV